MLYDIYILTSLFGTKAYLYINNYLYGKTNEVIRYEDKTSKYFISNIYNHIYNLILDPNHIIDNIYLGSAYNANNQNTLDKYGIKTILNVTDDLPNTYETLYNYNNIPIRDTRDSFISSYLATSYDYIIQHNKEPILVHCYMGSSRSASIVIYFLMKKYNLSFEDAHRIVKSKRDLINPNINFVNELKSKELFKIA